MIQAVNEAGHVVAGHGRSNDDTPALAALCECDAAILDADLLGEQIADVATTLHTRNIPALVLASRPSSVPQTCIRGPIASKPIKIAELLRTLSLMEEGKRRNPAATARMQERTASTRTVRQ
jgi:hypothetical protein